MPRPEAEYIPEPIRQAARSNQQTVQEFAESLGRSRNWLYGLFAGDQAKLAPYMRLAAFAGISIDDLAALIRQKRIGDLLSELREGRSMAALSQESGVSDSLLNNLAKNDGELKALNAYVLLAASCRCKIADLVTGSEAPKMSA